MALTPERSVAQRREALEHANAIRVYRAGLKRDVFAARVDADDLLARQVPSLETMKVLELMMAVPAMGRVKASKVFQRLGISYSKTIGGLSARQRTQLCAVLRIHEDRSPAYARKRAQAIAAGERKAET
jgi:hypothetical protein